MKKTIFICFEGPEGAGKSTQAKLLAQHLITGGYKVLITKEPGSEHDPVCYKIREILLHHIGKISDRTELLLFEADRAQHVENVLEKAQSYNFVISDRFDASSVAYQIYGRKIIDWGDFLKINNFAKNNFLFDFTFWIDINPETGLERGGKLGKSDRFQREKLEFHKKVREGYKEYFRSLPEEKWKMIDGSGSMSQIHKVITKTIKERFL